MKHWLKEIVIALVAGVLLPAALLRLGAHYLLREPLGETPALTQPPATLPQTASSVQIQPEQDTALQVCFRLENGNVITMDMDAYLIGAVLAEMPASFEEEALKAQSVAARTYALKAFVTGGKHSDGSVCGSYACCQAYISPQDYLNQGGSQDSIDKIRSCVLATTGQVLTYEGNLIEATYFSCSGGRTEDAQAVWGSAYPYLVAVDSPGEEGAAHYTDTVCIPLEEFQQKLNIVLPADKEAWFGGIYYTNGGGVQTMEIAGQLFTGTQLRGLLSLRSTSFRMEAVPDGIQVTTRGYGHRVGMSQYGADAMAVTGSGYADILSHYYPGTQLEYWNT